MIIKNSNETGNDRNPSTPIAPLSQPTAVLQARGKIAYTIPVLRLPYSDTMSAYYEQWYVQIHFKSDSNLVQLLYKIYRFKFKVLYQIYIYQQKL